MIVEIDSWTFHRSRRSFLEDRRRTLTLQVAGYEVIRVTDDLMTHTPQLIVAGVVRRLTGTPLEARRMGRRRR